jgi:hypothetical protein
MYTNLQELEDKLLAAEAIVEKLKAEKEAAEKANQKYELQGGDWSVHAGTNSVSNLDPSQEWASAGIERKTEVLAQSALQQIRAFSRMLAYVHEHCPQWEADWEDNTQKKYRVVFNRQIRSWYVDYHELAQNITVYMDKPTAIKLADDLNSGVFSLE